MWMVATGCLSRERLPIMSQAENHDPNTSFAWSEKGSINPTLHLRIHILRAQVSTKVTFQRRFFFESYANLQPKSIEGSKLKEKKLFHFAGLDAQQNGSFMHFLWIGGCTGVWSVASSKHGWSAELCTALIPQLRCLYKTLKRVVFLLSWCSWRQTPGGTTPKKGTGHWANCAQFANQWTHRKITDFQGASRISMKSCIQFQAGWNNPFDQLVQASSSLVAGSFYCKKKWREQQNKPIYHNMRLCKSRINIVQHISALK